MLYREVQGPILSIVILSLQKICSHKEQEKADFLLQHMKSFAEHLVVKWNVHINLDILDIA